MLLEYILITFPVVLMLILAGSASRAYHDRRVKILRERKARVIRVIIANPHKPRTIRRWGKELRRIIQELKTLGVPK